MIVPYNWLCDYVKINIGPKELASKLIMTGSAIDSCKKLSEGLENVVVGRIDSIEAHPDAAKLSVCNVFVGNETLQIVCGANNIFVNALVPVAVAGATLCAGIKISKAKIRGVFSYGMLCSGAELGIKNYPGADVDGILILQQDFVPGTPLAQALGLTDTIFDIEVGANRPDCLAIIGMARECAAALELPLIYPESSYTESGGDIDGLIKVEVKDSDICERYVARAVKNVRIKPSPKWLVDRLSSAGVRAINNIVDITNFVMLETGQPMHAFDYDKIRGNRIIVRRAKAGEQITTLDGKTRSLGQDMLLICDAQGAIGIAGVMGGENSEINQDTATVIFESAKFAQANVRKTSRSLGLATESAMRFSKGIDVFGCKSAMDRALHLIEQLDAGEIVSGEIDVLSADLSPRKVCVSADKINSVLGTNIDGKKMAQYLCKAFIPTVLKEGRLICDIPSFRGDISCGEDIAEEVARMFGYDNIPVTEMTGNVVRAVVPAEERFTDRIRALLVGSGFYECITYSFCSIADIEKLKDSNLCDCVKIRNPLGEEQAYMRISPLPDMLKVVANNLNKNNEDIRLFEAGRIYCNKDNSLPDEKKYICLAICSDEDFFSLKGVVENLAHSFGIRNLDFVFGAAPYYHPGRNARVFSGNIQIGQMGEVSKEVAESFGIFGKRVYAAQIMLSELIAASDDTKKYVPLPKFPAITRDIALILDKETPAGDLLKCISKNAGQHFESAALFDVYMGDNLDENKKSVAYSIVFRAKDRTLLDEEANAARDAIVSAAEKRFGAKLRD